MLIQKLVAGLSGLTRTFRRIQMVVRPIGEASLGASELLRLPEYRASSRASRKYITQPREFIGQLQVLSGLEQVPKEDWTDIVGALSTASLDEGRLSFDDRLVVVVSDFEDDPPFGVNKRVRSVWDGTKYGFTSKSYHGLCFVLIQRQYLSELTEELAGARKDNVERHLRAHGAGIIHHIWDFGFEPQLLGQKILDCRKG